MCRLHRTVRPFHALPLLTALVTTLCLGFLPGRATAGAYTYGTTAQRTINAGILLLDHNPTPGALGTWPTSAQPDNKDPYVFYILNQRTDLKPFGWSIVNPLAPSSVTADILARWNARSNQNTYQLGQTVSPAMAAYWEVPLTSTTSDNLAQYDVLLLNLEQTVSFTTADREKLRRFVDNGGTLWIEDSGGGNVNGGASLFFGLGFINGGATGNYALVSLLNRDALITTPFQLSEAELNSLGDKHIGGYYSQDSGNPNLPPAGLQTIVGNSGSTPVGLPVVAAGRFGAGEVVVTCTGSANAIDEFAGTTPYDTTTVGPNSGPFCATNIQNAPTPDLKLVADIVNAASSHLNEHQNPRQTGVDPGSLPSAQRVWTTAGSTSFPGSGTTGVAMYGHMAFATDNTGVVHAYDIYPAENLDNNPNNNPDQGLIDYNNGASYDEIWHSQGFGAGASAPTIAVDTSTGATNVYVLIEKNDGGVVAFNAMPTAGGVFAVTSAGALLANSGGRGTYTVPAPAPTFYNGRVYAGGPDGSLYIANFSGGVASNTAKFLVDPDTNVNVNNESVVAAPTVGIVPDGNGANDILALCTTNKGLYSVFLGSRGEQLKEVGNTAVYNTKLALLKNARLDTATVDYRLYTIGLGGLPTLQTAATVNNVAPNFSNTTNNTTDALFGDYDADFTASAAVQNGPLTRTLVAAADATNTPALAGALVSTPALDRNGNVYYTVTDTFGSVLFCVHDSPTAGSARVAWRFRLPKTGDPAFIDADNTQYAALAGYQFTTTNTAGGNSVTTPSAPVVDAQGNVYVLASGIQGATFPGTAILCFNSQAAISADLLASGDQSTITNVSVTQPIGGPDEYGNVTPSTLSGNQYSVSGGSIDFTNFATQQFVANSGGTHGLYPNLSEPYPVTVSYSLGGANNGSPQASITAPLHTNLAWYTAFNGQRFTPTSTVNAPLITASSGLTEVGSTLYFVASNGHLFSVPADVQAEGFAITNKAVDPSTTGTTGQALYTDNGDTEVGPTAAVPASAGGALLVAGPLGLSAYTNQVTLVVDNNRLLEMDAAGNAQWAVDSTTKTTQQGDSTAIYTGTGTPSGSQLVSTTVELNRPSSVYELAQNDYLVADTGNNRCVRFDRAGRVIWELSRFNDNAASPLLQPGEPTTLNQPTSVQVQTTTNGAVTTVRYLIADTGNFRVLEVDDVFQNGQTIANHVLAWVSHTHDIQNREYRYQSAYYYVSPVSGKVYVVALVANKRIAPFTLSATQTYGPAATSFLAPANQDTAGGSIVLLDYDPTNRLGGTGTFGANNQADGFISIDPTSKKLIVVSTITADLIPTGANAGAFDLAGTLNGTGTPKTLYIRNPRYLKVLVDQKTQARHYLLADDNGAWDLDGTSFQARWGFTQVDYHEMTNGQVVNGLPLMTPIDAIGESALQSFTPRANFPFIPTSIQMLSGTDPVGSGPTPVGRYLVTTSYAQGEAANNTGVAGYPFGGAPASGANYVPPGFGGEVFEVDHDVNGNAITGGYSNHTLSRPAGSNTSPLTQPTFAFRLQF